MEWNSRTRLLIGDPGLERLRKSHVLVAGLGGVGSALAESLCRAGVGELTLIDGDTIQESNLNRQLIALRSRLGQPKAQALAERLHDINPDLRAHVYTEFIRDERSAELLAQPYDYVADAIDTLSPKLHFIRLALENGQRLVSSMGAGGKIDPTQLRIAPIEESHGCRLAFIVRKKLHRMGIRQGFTVVFSPEPVPPEAMMAVDEQNKKTRVGTISYMPPLFGGFMASVILRYLIQELNPGKPSL
ncbi:MAG TPA: tRNA threonylcarbamoyladenosine dehydratase [Bacteroidales bacterium]|nr:tRNA threonylcarbamoyladenosine dehydratase [Bacteroidales bacterium]HRZ76197.1 tRNA threonylcarbamoyladenosine dehydratase [Bacteroidales bacterium]